MNRKSKTVERQKEDLLLNFDGEELRCILTVPEGARSIVLFIGCGGSSRESVFCAGLADYLNERGYASLLMDHLTPEEQSDDCGTIKLYGFETDYLSRRLVQTAVWIKTHKDLKNLRLGFFTEGGTAEAAFNAVTELRNEVRAVVVSGSIGTVTESTNAIHVPTLFLLPAHEIEEVEAALALSSMNPESRVDVINLAEPVDNVTKQICELTIAWFEYFLLK